MTNLETLMADAQTALTVKRVYGEPYEKNGVTFIPAAAVRGGGGGGEGDDSESASSGMGGGFGLSARPVGAFQIKGEEVAWIPAADTTRVIVMAEVLAMVLLLVLRSVFRARGAGG